MWFFNILFQFLLGIMASVVAAYLFIILERWRTPRLSCEERDKNVYCLFVQPILTDFIDELRIIHSSFRIKPKWFYVWQMMILFVEYVVAFTISVLQAATVLIVDKVSQWISTK